MPRWLSGSALFSQLLKKEDPVRERSPRGPHGTRDSEGRSRGRDGCGGLENGPLAR